MGALQAIRGEPGCLARWSLSGLPGARRGVSAGGLGELLALQVKGESGPPILSSPPRWPQAPTAPLPRSLWEEEARLAFCRRGWSGRRLAWSRPPQPGSAPQATRCSLSGLAPFPLPSPWVPRPTSALPARYPPSPHPRPPRLAPGSGAGPVTSSPVWRRRDWPARAIKRATSSFPITHCQSGNWGGPAGN